MSLKTSLEKLADLTNKRDEVHFSFIKQILLMASGLLSILVALHKTNSTDNKTRILFSLALGLLSLGILMLTVALYAQVAVHKTQFIEWKEEVIKLLKDDNYRPKIIFGGPANVYTFCEKLGYYLLSLSVICLTIYAMFIA